VGICFLFLREMGPAPEELRLDESHGPDIRCISLSVLFLREMRPAHTEPRPDESHGLDAHGVSLSISIRNSYIYEFVM
jgi:hypothetical protein